MEGGGGAGGGKEAASNFQSAVGEFGAGVVGRVDPSFYFLYLIRCGGVKELAYACLTLLFDGVRVEIFSCV